MMKTTRLIVPLVVVAAAIAGACGGEAFSARQTSAGGGSSNSGGAANPSSPSGNAGTQGGSGTGNAGSSSGGTVGSIGCEQMSECEDDNPCTLDVCASDGICLNVPIDGPCRSDDDECTNDVCSGGLCTHPANGTCDCSGNQDCDDSNPCTDDSCSEGSCQYQNNNDPCANDNNECTDDQCSEGACMHTNNDAPCADEGDECTDDVCGGGLCTHPSNGQCGCEEPADCDDSNPCTEDSCDQNGDCQYANNTNPCADDGNTCTEDKCEGGSCGHILKGEPIPEKASWLATASHSPEAAIALCVGDATQPPSQAIDAMVATRWTTGKLQSGDEWFQIDFGSQVTLNRINLDGFGLGEGNCTTSGPDFPRHYQVRVSDVSVNTEAPVLVEGEGAAGNTMIQLPQPATGRYVLISQTGASPSDPASWWSIHEINVACQ